MSFTGFNYLYIFIVIASVAMIVSLIVIALHHGKESIIDRFDQYTTGSPRPKRAFLNAGMLPMWAVVEGAANDLECTRSGPHFCSHDGRDG